jgi:hypothetical protein
VNWQSITWEILAIGTYIGEIYFGNMLEPTVKTWSSQTFFSLKYGEFGPFPPPNETLFYDLQTPFFPCPKILDA